MQRRRLRKWLQQFCPSALEKMKLRTWESNCEGICCGLGERRWLRGQNQALSQPGGLRGDQERKEDGSRGGLETITWYSLMEHRQSATSSWAMGEFLGDPLTGRLFGLVSTAATATIGMIEFMLPGERMCPTELGRDRNQEDHKRWEGNSWGRESLKGS